METEIGSKCTLWRLFAEYDEIRVPAIQRDYVQGRDDRDVESIRNEFVGELVRSALSGAAMSLNFMYGEEISEDGKKIFVPIDGQQRLTTLFLLHLCVWANMSESHTARDEDVKRVFNKFKYNTRTSSGRFIGALVNEGLGLVNGAFGEGAVLSVKKAVEDSFWFSSSWSADPTIHSCLEVLDTMRVAFGKEKIISWETCWENLTEKDCVSFMFLNLSNDRYGSSSELYIRMNSRGRQLTDYESFKAELYEQGISAVDEVFKEKLDNEWYSAMWDIVSCNVGVGASEKSAFADRTLLCVFRAAYTNMLCENPGVDFKKLGVTPAEIERDMKDVTSYSEKREEFAGEFSRLMNFLSWFYGETVGAAAPSDPDLEKLRSHVAEIFFDFDNKKRKPQFLLCQYRSRYLLYIVTKFASSAEGDFASYPLSGLKELLRVFGNFVGNIDFDTPEKFVSAVRAVKKLSEAIDFIPDFINALKSEPGKKLFEEAVEESPFMLVEAWEEEEKLDLIYVENEKSPDAEWKELIYEADGYLSDWKLFDGDGVWYFGGEIGFILRKAAEMSDKNLPNPKTFKNLCVVLFRLFGIFGRNTKPECFVKLHQGLMLCGNYSLPYRDESSFYFPAHLDRHKNNDWRAFLRRGEDGAWPKAYECLSSFLDGFTEWLGSQGPGNNFSDEDVRKYVDALIEKYRNDVSYDALGNDERFLYKLMTNDGYLRYMGPRAHSKYMYFIDGGKYFLKDRFGIEMNLDDKDFDEIEAWNADGDEHAG
ncbi:MAG: DUF262 domain-containing protein [Clostridia bacterium]|nr:DUF262 domain-containing protein [Clostridia bacterium]